MPRTLRFSLALILLVNFAALADPTADFQALLEESWEWQLLQNPVFASSLGDRRFSLQGAFPFQMAGILEFHLTIVDEKVCGV